MDCQTFKQRLSEFLDRQLAASELALAESHLAQCSGCRTEYEDLRGLSRIVAGLGRKPLPVGFMQRLERRRRAEDAPAEKTYYLLPPGLPRMAAFAMSSLIVMVVVYGKARDVMQPQSMISGAAGSLGESSTSYDALSSAASSKRVMPVDKVSLGGGTVRGLGALSGVRGAGSGAGGNFEALKKAAAEPKPADSIVPQTARLLQASARGESVDDKAAVAAAAAAAPKREYKTGSITSTGQKLAAARGEPIADAGAAFGGAGGGVRPMMTKKARAQSSVAAVRGGFVAGMPTEAAPTAPATPAAEAEHAYTNEEIAADIEKQKKEMGISKIIPPGADQPPPDILEAMRLTSGGPNAVKLAAAPSAANLSGDTPRLIAATSRPSPFSSRGHVMAQAAVTTPAEKPGPLDEAPGVLIHSEAERQDLWHKYEMTTAPPNVDYSSQMLAVVFATNPSTAVDITRVSAGADQVTITFHERALPPGSDRHAVPTYSLRVIPKTEKAVVFEKLP